MNKQETKQSILKDLKAQRISLQSLINMIRKHDTKKLTVDISNHGELIFLTNLTSLN